MTSQQPYDSFSARPCLKCGHALPHNEIDEREGDICSYQRMHRVAGYDCGHKRWSKRCERENVSIGSCYSYGTACECTESDRLIADLRARIAELEAA
jgi:hypothetical protein